MVFGAVKTDQGISAETQLHFTVGGIKVKSCLKVWT